MKYIIIYFLILTGYTFIYVGLSYFLAGGVIVVGAPPAPPQAGG